MRVSTVPEPDAKARKKPAGGFILVSVSQLIAAWSALRLGLIGLRDLRVWFALWELKARRCRLADGQTPEFSSEEVRRLVGGEGGDSIRECLRHLVAAGLIRTLTKERIELSDSLDDLKFEADLVQETLDKIPHYDRLVPLPRRIVRLIAGGARRTLIATILGHAIRCLWFRKGFVHPAGSARAAWIADVFGVSERRVHEQRTHLFELGILVAQDTPQRVMNRHGLWVAFNLDWSSSSKEALSPSEAKPEATGAGGEEPARLSPPPPEITPQTVTPIETGNSPYGRSENQEPASRPPASGGPAGVFIKEQGEGSPEKTPEPTLRNVVPADLREPARLMVLHGQAIAEGVITTSEADRLNFFAAANHARVIGSVNPPGLFVRIVRGKLFGYLTQDDEDAARTTIRRALYPEHASNQSSRGGPFPAVYEAATRPPQLSEDARFVRDITNVLRQKGVPESSAWRLVNRERPEWTRERWDEALAELDGLRIKTSSRA